MERQADIIAFGKQLRTLREAKGWTQLELSFETGIDPSYLSKIERGKTDPSISTVIVITRALGCKIQDLIQL